MLIVEIVIVILIFLIIISQRIGIRITKNEATTVYVNFIFTAIRIDNNKKKRRIKLSKAYNNHFFIKSALDYLLPRTDVTIFSLDASDEHSLTKTVLNNILFNTALTYVKRSAKNVIYKNDSESDIDLEISFILYHGIISLILGQYYKTKNKILGK